MVGEPFNKRSVPCAFGIKIGLYFHKKRLRFAGAFFNEINPCGGERLFHSGCGKEISRTCTVRYIALCSKYFVHRLTSFFRRVIFLFGRGERMRRLGRRLWAKACSALARPLLLFSPRSAEPPSVSGAVFSALRNIDIRQNSRCFLHREFFILKSRNNSRTQNAPCIVRVICE